MDSQNSQNSQKILKQTPLKGSATAAPSTPRKPLLDCTNKGEETPLSKLQKYDSQAPEEDDPAHSSDCNDDSAYVVDVADDNSWFVQEGEEKMPIATEQTDKETLQRSLKESLEENEILHLTNKALQCEVDQLTKKLEDLQFISILYQEAKNEIKDLEKTILETVKSSSSSSKTSTPTKTTNSK